MQDTIRHIDCIMAASALPIDMLVVDVQERQHGVRRDIEDFYIKAHLSKLRTACTWDSLSSLAL